MQGYKFSLDKVLDWRSDKEEQAQRKVGELQARKAEEEMKLERLLKESMKLKAESIFAGNVDSMRQQSLYQELTSQRIIQQKLVIEKTEHQIDEAKAALIEAHKEKKVLEKLKEKNHAAYIQEELKAEQHQLDELSVLQFGRSIF